VLLNIIFINDNRQWIIITTVKILANVFQVDFYRFSISWARVLPQGDDRSPNVKGIEYYKTLIDKLVENNIQPVVTYFI
jgi:beta-glucosidase/6-phospho-beta-glucosidase/beta-galactosidase